MKPRNKTQRVVATLSAAIHPISDKQREWGIRHAYTSKERSYEKTIYRYFVISSRVKEWQVCRFFQVRKQRQVYEFLEPMRLWFDTNGHMEIEAMNRFSMSSRIDAWILGSPLSLKNTPMAYKDYTVQLSVCASKVTSMIPILKRNGLKGSFHDMQPRDVIEGLLKNNMFETLWKCRQFSLLQAFAYEWNRDYENVSIMSAVRIALRHNYHVDDGRMWVDMVTLLERAHMDIRNPKFVCPTNLKAAHDEALELCTRYEDAQRKNKDKEKLLENKKVVRKYELARKKFMGMLISDDKIKIEVLSTVKSVMEEGYAMHHCVFANEYYKRLDSLLLTAKVNGERAETIEVDLKRYQLVQSRGVCNQNSKYHDEIVSLVNENMNVIRKFNKAV